MSVFTHLTQSRPRCAAILNVSERSSRVEEEIAWPVEHPIFSNCTKVSPRSTQNFVPIRPLPNYKQEVASFNRDTLRNHFRYVKNVARKSQVCETFQRRAMPLNRKARVNATTGSDARLIAREETRGDLYFRCGERLTIENARVPVLSRDVSRPTTFVLKLEASPRSGTGFDFQRKCRAPFYASSFRTGRKQFQRRYGRENIEPRDRLTRFRILETISHIFLIAISTTHRAYD